MTARLRVVTPAEADAVARERLIAEALRMAIKFRDYKRLGHKTMNVGAGDGLVAAAEELLPDA